MAHNTDLQKADITLFSLQQKWEIAFPSQLVTIQSLRDTLIYAEFALQHSRAAWLGFHQTVQIGCNQAEPYLLWPTSLISHFHALKSQQEQDTRHFTQALQALQNAYTAEQSPKPKAAARTSTPAPLPPEPEPDPPAPVLQQQMVQVRVEDDQVTTTVDRDAAFWCQADLWNVSSRFTRHFHFPNALIPEPYSYVLAHHGVSYPAAPYFSISYSPQEFARLCQLELDTASPYLLDGQRLSYSRREDSIEELRATYHAQHEEN